MTTRLARRFLQALSLPAALASFGLLGGCAVASGEPSSDTESDLLTCAPSAIAEAVHAAASRGASTTSAPLASNGNRVVVGPLVEGQAIGDALFDLVASAKSEVLVEVFDLDETSWLAARLRDAIRSLPSSVRVYILANPVGGQYGNLGSLFSSIPESQSHLVRRLQGFFGAPNVKIAAWKTGWNPFNILHSKAVVVDGKRALVLDSNLQPHSDPRGASAKADGWFQLGMVVEGEIVTALRDDAVRGLANGAPRVTVPAMAATAPVAACTPMVFLGRNAGAGLDSSADRGYSALFQAARKTLRVITPNLNDSGALAALAAATKNADVDLVLSRGFNDTTESLPGQGGTNEKNVGRLAAMAANPCKLHIRWFSREAGVAIVGNGVGASHAKWASADGQAMILGSQNLDTQSWKQSRELGVLVDHAATTSAFDAVFDDVWARSPVAYECR